MSRLEAVILLACLCGLPAFGQAAVVNVDGTALSYQWVIVDGSFYPATSVASLTLATGAHVVTASTGALPAPSIPFTVDGSGNVDFSPAFDGFVSGRGTSTLVLSGLPVTVDATSLSYQWILIDWIPGGGPAASAPAALRLLPGAHRLRFGTGAVPAPVVDFSVDTAGTVDFSAALDGWVSGRGTATLVVDGFDVSLDATNLSYEYVLIDWVPGGGPLAAAPIPLRLLPGAHRIRWNTWTGAAGPAITFSVGTSGAIDFDSALDGYVSGRGTDTLTLTGFGVTLDGTATSYDFFIMAWIPGLGAYNAGTVALQLLPGSHRILVNTSAAPGPSVDFTLEPSGLLDFALALDPFVSGRGTSLLTLGGSSAAIIATALGPAASFTLGGTDGSPFSAATIHTFALLPGRHRVTVGASFLAFQMLADQTCTPSKLVFPDGPVYVTCPAAYCGDGVVGVGEFCDDGNDLLGDGCRPDCTEELCGDAVVDPQEQCDDGNLASGDGCQANCALPVCGDGYSDAGEECDDGNVVGADGCSGTCQIEVCGNAILDPGEQCDDANALFGDGCRPDCTQELCGDGLLDPQEACDDANSTPGDGCRADCSVELCGDGVLDPQEQCDDGNVTSGDGCQAACILPICGDDVVDAGEQCDDGNLGAGDGCSASCALEVCGNGVLDPGEACDDGNVASADGCRENCTLELCGDGLLDPQEQCDDGNASSGDGCSGACEMEQASGGEGCSHGYWKQPHHFDSWPAGISPNAPFASVFENAFPGLSLVQVLRQGGGGLKALGREAVAALLNASSTQVDYDLGAAEVVSMFAATHPGSTPSYNTLKDNFESLNQQGCPLD